MSVKRFDQLIGPSVNAFATGTRSFSHDTSSTQTKQRSTRNHGTDDEIGSTGSFRLGDEHPRKKIYCLCTNAVIKPDAPLYRVILRSFTFTFTV